GPTKRIAGKRPTGLPVRSGPRGRRPERQRRMASVTARAALARGAATPGTPRTLATARTRATAAARSPAPAPSRFTGARHALASALALFALGERQELTAAQPNLAVALDADDLDFDLVTLGEDVRRGIDALVRHLRDVEERLRVRQDLDERAEIRQPPYGATIDAPDLRLGDEPLDDGES